MPAVCAAEPLPFDQQEVNKSLQRSVFQPSRGCQNPLHTDDFLIGNTRVILFLRAPRLGEVKSRLAKTLGPAAALHAYRQLAETTLARMAPVPHGEVRFTPDDAAADLAPWQPPGWPLRPQGPGDLGERMHRALGDAFAEGARAAAVIGGDCPWMEPSDIEAAWAALDAHDLVIGPAADGGYWLIGMRAPQAALFNGVVWGSARVVSQTLAKARNLGLRARLLRVLCDVDDERDWRAFLSSPPRPLAGSVCHWRPGSLG